MTISIEKPVPAIPEKTVDIQHTPFDADKIQAIVDKLWALKSNNTEAAPKISSYDEFAALVPTMNGSQYTELAQQAFKQHTEVPVLIGGSSGTTGPSKLILERTNTPGSRPSEDDIQLITELRMAGALNPGDVVVNLFMVGMYSLLHQGFNRILEACYCSVIPLGSLNTDHLHNQLTFMANAEVNVLVGTPGTLIQMANAVKDSGITLNIKRILFTGERMGEAKANVLKAIFPGVRIIGCYGLSECGFVAVEQFNGKYQVRDYAYFLEKSAQGRLLVTSLNPNLPTPVVRYDTGDQFNFISLANKIFLDNLDRADNSFNFIGNLIKCSTITTLASEFLAQKDVLIEVALDTDEQGRDNLLITLLVDGLSLAQCQTFEAQLCQLEDFREALDKRAGTVSVVCAPPQAATLSERNKHRTIVDRR